MARKRTSLIELIGRAKCDCALNEFATSNKSVTEIGHFLEKLQALDRNRPPVISENAVSSTRHLPRTTT